MKETVALFHVQQRSHKFLRAVDEIIALRVAFEFPLRQIHKYVVNFCFDAPKPGESIRVVGNYEIKQF